MIRYQSKTNESGWKTTRAILLLIHFFICRKDNAKRSALLFYCQLIASNTEETATSECLSAAELFWKEGGKCREEGDGGGVRLEHKWNLRQRSYFILCSKLSFRKDSACTCVSALTGPSHSKQLFVSAVRFAARAAVSRGKEKKKNWTGLQRDCK